ncbi:MAG: pantoate--beta-alanine ligase [Bacteroidales bacterium]|nr:pantoate--beta-alanine ligase [Bacteroidales bacterium]
MIVLKHIKDLKAELQARRNQGQTIGFVPTMGALHQGHLSLMQCARNQCDVVVVSIFVNPTQFNNKDDYEKYPRLFDKDIELLQNTKVCDIVFLPDEKEMYPTAEKRSFDLGYLEEVMEGAFRPGHFQGVALIVSKLFDIVMPHKAYFGKKDFQQLAVIRRLVELEKYPIEIVPCDIVREPHGLAMSSRNLRLSKIDFENAKIIYQTLSHIPEWIKVMTIQEIKTKVIESIESVAPFKVEYIEMVNTFTLKPIIDFKQHTSVTACIAVFCNDVRLIDNIEIKL